jgi:NADH:ubiquinone oxidoreductase subunit 5 (subunit L)/multisubunit Na+/H+ antiporter MnhA subunit
MSELFLIDNLSIFVAIFVAFFSLLILIYSIGFMPKKKGLFSYYLYMFLTLAASLGAVFANNLILFMVFWGFLGMLLYLLIEFGEKKHTSATAKKAFILIGGTDAFMLLGLAFIWKLTGTFDMDKLSIGLDNRLAVFAYLCLAVGAFAKAGAMPFHTWVPDAAEDAPTPVTAFLPASLDKLLGIYFLARISLNVFRMDSGMNTFLMVVGSVTIIAAIMMALIQNDLQRLLGYSTVSQVGYMILGIGTGNPIGIAGSLFHMLNNAIYKSCLFLCGGVVEKKTGTTDLAKLGGLAKAMPVTFIAFLIASFSISGVPPFNGFASKWMIYQGIIESGKSGNNLWILWLIAAMVGSALTLASFMKLIHAVFLGQPSKETAAQKKQEAGPAMLLPVVVLAFFCVLFGVFAYQIPLKLFIGPALNLNDGFSFSGIWQASLATALILMGLGIGLLIYYLGTAARVRESETFIGGENIKLHPDMRVSGTAFYNTIEEYGILRLIYSLAKKKVFDVYEVGTRLTFGFNRALRAIHNGVLPTYLSWCLLGMLFLFYCFLK